MAIKYYKSATDDGGAVGDEIQGGIINNLFSRLPASDRVSGVIRFRKIWYESDVDLTDINPTIPNDGQFYYRVFKSDNDDDTVDDLTGNERKYGSLTIVDIDNSGSTSQVRLQRMGPDELGPELFDFGDKVLIGDTIYTINGALSDHGDGTFSFPIDGVASESNEGTLCYSLIETDGATAGTKYPVWIEEVVWAGAQGSGIDYKDFALVV